MIYPRTSKLLRQNGINPNEVLIYGFSRRGYMRVHLDPNGKPGVVRRAGRVIRFITTFEKFKGIPAETLDKIFAAHRAESRN